MRSFNKTLGRRALLGSIASSAAALPFLRSFPLSAHGAIAQPKVLFLGFPSGALVGENGNAQEGYEGWRPPGFTGNEAPLANTLTQTFAPLQRHRDNLLFLEGLSMLDNNAPHRNCASLLTGRPRYYPPGQDEDSFTSNGISVDQFLAAELGTNVLNTAYRTTGGQAGEAFWSYTGAEAPVTPIQDPTDSYERVFGEGLSDPGLGAQLLAQRTSVLDHVAGEVSAMKARIPSVDRQRLDQHLAAIEAVEAELLAAGDLSCEDPEAPPAYDWMDVERAPEIFLAHARTTVQAMQCGWGRVGTIQFGNFAGGALRPKWPDWGIDADYSMHNIAHAFSDVGNYPDELGRAQSVALGISLETVVSEIIAQVIDMLTEALDVDGEPMINSTMVAALRPMGFNHEGRRPLWIIGGGDGVGVRGGRFMKIGDGGQNTRYYNDFLTTTCRTMGADVDCFGDEAFCSEPIDMA